MRKGGLEPPRIAPHAPQTCASTNSATSARDRLIVASGWGGVKMGGCREARQGGRREEYWAERLSLRCLFRKEVPHGEPPVDAGGRSAYVGCSPARHSSLLLGAAR